MTINLLKHFLQKKEAFYPIGLTVQTGEHPLEIVGIKRTKKETILVALEKVDDGLDAAQASEYMRFENEGPHRFTNRTVMKRHSEPRVQHGYHHLRKVFIDGHDFDVKSYETRRIMQTELESVLDLYEFMRAGWSSDVFDHAVMDGLMIIRATLSGDGIEKFKPSNLSEITFERHPYPEHHYVEKPMTLAIGEDFPDKIYFEATDSHEKQWAQIHRVSLTDIYETLETNLNDPKMLEHASPEQLTNMKREMERNFQSICPRGMHLPVIEYECEADITLQFYHLDYLEAKPSSGGVSAFGFIMGSDQQVGKWGYPIKVCVIQHAVPKETESIDVELFSFSRMMK